MNKIKGILKLIIQKLSMRKIPLSMKKLNKIESKGINITKKELDLVLETEKWIKKNLKNNSSEFIKRNKIIKKIYDNLTYNWEL